MLLLPAKSSVAIMHLYHHEGISKLSRFYPLALGTGIAATATRCIAGWWPAERWARLELLGWTTTTTTIYLAGRDAWDGRSPEHSNRR